MTSFAFIFLVGVIVSSGNGAYVLWVGEWFIKPMPLVKHIYSAFSRYLSRYSFIALLEPSHDDGCLDLR